MSSGVASKNVAKKILEMIKNTGEIPKTGFNQKFNYKFTKETDVADALRAACLKVGLVVIPSIFGVTKDTFKTGSGGDNFRVSLMLKLTLIDPDSGESIEMDFPGESLDTQDKAVPKAITSAYKYALLKLAMNGGGDGDDPEHESHEQRDTTGKSAAQGSGKQTEVKSGATYRAPAEPTQGAAETNQPAKKTDTQSTTEPAGVKGHPADRPLSARTQPTKVAQTEPAKDGNTTTATADVTGTITAVVPAMRGKPATMTLTLDDKKEVMTISFDPTNQAFKVADLLKFQNTKQRVTAILDITNEPPFLVGIEIA